MIIYYIYTHPQRGGPQDIYYRSLPTRTFTHIDNFFDSKTKGGPNQAAALLLECIMVGSSMVELNTPTASNFSLHFRRSFCS